MNSIYQVKSANELLQAFRSRDQRRVELPAKNAFPMSFEYYFTWAENSGNFRYLVFRSPKGLVGMVFEPSKRAAVATTRLCEWCHSFGASDQIDLMMVSPNSKRTVGILLCTDLGCLQRIETAGRITCKTYPELARELLDRILRFYTLVFD